jgi:phage-related protein
MHGMGSGVFEVALAFRGDAYRVIYTVQLADEIWVVHAFQKKSTEGVKTPRREVDLIKDRLKRLKEMLRGKVTNWKWCVAAGMFSTISGARTRTRSSLRRS